MFFSVYKLNKFKLTLGGHIIKELQMIFLLLLLTRRCLVTLDEAVKFCYQGSQSRVFSSDVLRYLERPRSTSAILSFRENLFL